MIDDVHAMQGFAGVQLNVQPCNAPLFKGMLWKCRHCILYHTDEKWTVEERFGNVMMI